MIQRRALAAAVLLKRTCETLGVEWDPAIISTDLTVDEDRYHSLRLVASRVVFPPPMPVATRDYIVKLIEETGPLTPRAISVFWLDEAKRLDRYATIFGRRARPE